MSKNVRYFSRYFVLPLAGIAIALSSCTPEGNGILGSKASQGDVVDAKTEAAPFAFDIAADTISYNSCVNLNNSTTGSGSAPSLKIGVHEGFVTTNGNGAVKGGIKLKTEFLRYIGQNFKPSSQSTVITSAQVKEILASSKQNKDAFLQFSVRRKSDLSIFVDQINPGGNNNPETAVPKAPRDAAVILKELSTGSVASLLTKQIQFATTGTVLAEGGRIYNLSDNAQPAVIEAQFGYNQTADESFPVTTDPLVTNKEAEFGLAEFFGSSVRKRFSSNGSDKIFLTTVFGGNAQPTLTDSVSGTIVDIRKSPTADNSKAYGRAYALTFSSKAPGVAGWDRNVLSGTAVTEIDLATGSQVAGVTWSCEHFPIVRASEFNYNKLDKAHCMPLLAEDLTSTRQLQIKKLRRHYSKNDWEIGLFVPANTALGVTHADRKAKRLQFGLCVSPKTMSCYLPTDARFMDNPSLLGTKNEFGIQYDTSKECYVTAYNAMGFSYGGSEDTKRMLGRCAQYASICVRSSTNF